MYLFERDLRETIVPGAHIRSRWFAPTRGHTPGRGNCAAHINEPVIALGHAQCYMGEHAVINAPIAMCLNTEGLCRIVTDVRQPLLALLRKILLEYIGVDYWPEPRANPAVQGISSSVWLSLISSEKGSASSLSLAKPSRSVCVMPK